jgi:hypothetical protein
MMDVCKFKPGNLVRYVTSGPGWSITHAPSDWQNRIGLVLADAGHSEPASWTVNFAGTIRTLRSSELEKVQ